MNYSMGALARPVAHHSLTQKRRMEVIAMTKEITTEVLRGYFHLPIAQVAKALGVCTTLMKKICRKNKIFRWPYRQLRSIDNNINTAKKTLSTTSITDLERTRLMNLIIALQRKREGVITNPNFAVHFLRMEEDESEGSAARNPPTSDPTSTRTPHGTQSLNSLGEPLRHTPMTTPPHTRGSMPPTPPDMGSPTTPHASVAVQKMLMQFQPDCTTGCVHLDTPPLRLQDFKPKQVQFQQDNYVPGGYGAVDAPKMVDMAGGCKPIAFPLLANVQRPTQADIEQPPLCPNMNVGVGGNPPFQKPSGFPQTRVLSLWQSEMLKNNMFNNTMMNSNILNNMRQQAQMQERANLVNQLLRPPVLPTADADALPKANAGAKSITPLSSLHTACTEQRRLFKVKKGMTMSDLLS
jgi:hypothetical protein